MSHFSTIQTRFVSGPHLVAALRSLGHDQVEFHEQPQPLAGSWITLDSASAEIILRREHLRGAGSDIGFRRNSAGLFEAVIETMDQSRGYHHGWLQGITQRYAYQVARSTLESQDFGMVEEDVSEEGVIHLVLRRQV